MDVSLPLLACTRARQTCSIRPSQPLSHCPLCHTLYETFPRPSGAGLPPSSAQPRRHCVQSLSPDPHLLGRLSALVERDLPLRLNVGYVVYVADTLISRSPIVRPGENTHDDLSLNASRETVALLGHWHCLSPASPQSLPIPSKI